MDIKMRRHGWIWVCLMAVLLVFPTVSCAGGSNTVHFDALGEKFTVELPEEYLAYTPAMGADSPLLTLSKSNPAEMDQYMSLLGCAVCAAHNQHLHQLWISVMDRSGGFPNVPDGQDVPIASQRAFFDGIAFTRGSYTEKVIDGKTYFVFENNPSVTPGGASIFVATMYGKREISVRWESGSGRKTSDDLDEILKIAESIIPGA